MSIPTVPQSIIDQFVGQKVEVATQTRTLTSAGRPYTVTDVEIVSGDPVIAALEKDAEAHGLNLRICTPTARITKDHRLDRLNVRIGKGPNGGHYRITDLSIG